MATKFTPMATFRGIKRVPLLALSHNALLPSLTIGPDGVTIRVLRRHHFAFAEITRISCQWRLAQQITFEPRDGPFTFSANFATRDGARAVLQALAAHGAPLDASCLRLL